MKRRNFTRPIYALMLAAVLATTIMPAGPADAATAKQPKASATKILKKQVTALQRQVRTPRQRVEAMRGQAGSAAPPSGPAGGDLTGTFPNPLIARPPSRPRSWQRPR